MSHISILKTRLTDKTILIEALEALGYEVTEGENLIISGANRKTKVDFQIAVPWSDPIGFRSGKNGYQIVADWFKIQLDRKQFQDRLLQQYAYVAVKKSVSAQGFSVVQEETSQDNRIHLVFRRNG